MRSHTRITAALLGVVAVAAAGCSEIPTSGPVIGGGSLEPPSGQQQRFIEIEAPPPNPGDDAVGIVDGFIESMASYEPGYETARQFLTEEAAASWDPSAGVTVHHGATPVVEAVGENIVTVRMTVSATVGSDGSYVAAEPGTTRQLDLRLQRENGEWRIENPADGIVIAVFSFDREYEPRNVYFFDSGFEVLVPDPVYVPRSASTATLLARRLLAGPSSWLAPAVRTAFPEGTELDVNAVPVEEGLATVELSDEAAAADPEDRQLMTAQLTWTLGMLPDVETVEVVTSGRIPLTQSDPLSPASSSMSEYDPAVLPTDTPLFAIGEAGVVSLSDGELTPVRGPLGALPDVREVAVNVGGNRAVVVSAEGSELQIATFGDDEIVETVLHGVDLSSPAWDRSGLIWAVDHGVDGPGLVVTSADGQLVDVVAPELAGLDVDRLAVSPDGARIALVVGGQAFVGDIVRDADKRATIRVEQPRPIGPDGEALDVAWNSSAGTWNAADSIVVLLRTEQQDVLTYTVGLSGQVTTLRGVPADDATSVTSVPGLPVVLETGDGILYAQRSSNNWAEIGAGRSPTYPG